MVCDNINVVFDNWWIAIEALKVSVSVECTYISGIRSMYVINVNWKMLESFTMVIKYGAKFYALKNLLFLKQEINNISEQNMDDVCAAYLLQKFRTYKNIIFLWILWSLNNYSVCFYIVMIKNAGD